MHGSGKLTHRNEDKKSPEILNVKLHRPVETRLGIIMNAEYRLKYYLASSNSDGLHKLFVPIWLLPQKVLAYLYRLTICFKPKAYSQAINLLTGCKTLLKVTRISSSRRQLSYDWY